jgi:hypothetical protein
MPEIALEWNPQIYCIRSCIKASACRSQIVPAAPRSSAIAASSLAHASPDLSASCATSIHHGTWQRPQQRSADMSSVELGDFFESGGYFVHVATAFHHGAWLSWAEFKLDMEYGDGCVQVPVYRHSVPGAFTSKAVAVESGLGYAHQAIEKDTVIVPQPQQSSSSRNASLH